MAIHHKLDYERMYNLENNINSIIWIKVKIKRQSPTLVMSGYRQHKLLDEFQVKNSHMIWAQKVRLTSYLETYHNAAKLGLDIIIMEDSNIDMNPKDDYTINSIVRTCMILGLTP